MTTAEFSRFLFTPVTLVLYLASALLYLRAMAAPRIDAVDGKHDGSGSGSYRAALVLAVLGVSTHTAHIVMRTLAADRLPLGNMFEFSSAIALTIVVVGLVAVHWRMRRPELMGFIVLGAVVTLSISLLLYNDPAPLQPILDTWWRAIHVTTISISAGLFSLAAVFNALHLLRDTAEVRVAEHAGSSFGERSVGAAQAPTGTDRTQTDTDRDGVDVSDDVHEEVDDLIGTTPARIAGSDAETTGVDPDDAAYAAALRAVLTQEVAGVTAPWRLLAGVTATVGTFSLIWWDAGVTLAMVGAMLVLTLVAWWAVPYLPTATTLDRLTYRTIAFSFPIWTFAVITGAMWAEQSWGRFWGWDPKETSAFVTWVAYAGYLHARATRGLKRRRASWLGLLAFGVFLFTYYAVNLLVVGLHSYGGIDQTVGA